MAEEADAWAKETSDLWNAGQPGRLPKTYVNYSLGHEYETFEGIYGPEPERAERLRSLKQTYDPNNRFRFYVPIISDLA